VALQPRDQIAIGCFFDHLGKRFEDLLLGIIDVLKTMEQQVLHRFDVFGKKSHCSLLFGESNGTPMSVRSSIS